MRASKIRTEIRREQIARAALGVVERHGRREGCIRAGVDPEAASILFLGLIQPAVVLRAMSGGEFDARAHAGIGWQLFVEAIGQGPAAPPEGSKSPRPLKSENAP